MKKLSLFALAATGMLLGACSDKDVTQDIAVNPDEFQDGAYIGISLSLPSADNNATRANDDLSNGITAEFAVKNATLYIFKATASQTEGQAVYVDYVTLGTTYRNDTQGGINPDEWGVQPGVSSKTNGTPEGETYTETNITSTSLNEATKISNELAAQIKGDANKYFAYVIINHNGQVPSLTKNTTTFADFSRSKFEKIGADIALEQNIWNDGMLMTSAPICNYPGGLAAPVKGSNDSDPDVAYTTLVPIDKNKIFQNAAQAKQEPAACVYVERAAVKITVENGASLSSSKIDGYDVTVNGWKVINTERSYYNTRQINYKSTENVESGANAWGNTTAWTAEAWGGYTNDAATPAAAKYRFVSYYQFLPTLPSGLKDGYTHTKGYRTYFAADPNYSVDAQAATNSTESTLNFTTANDDRPWIAAGRHAYTTENTFDVKHQTWRNTTMVTVKVALSKTASGTTTNPDFYTVGKGSQTMFDAVADVQALIHNLVMNDAGVATAAENLLNLISKNNTDKTVTQGIAVNFTAPTVATTGVAYTVTPAYTITTPASGETPASTANATYNGAADATITDTSNPLYGKTEMDLKVALEIAIAKVLFSDFNQTTLNNLTDQDDPADGVNDEIEEYLGTLTTYKDNMLLSFYNDGEMYYNVKIQHFGEVETPWGGTDVVANGSGVNVNEIYFNTLYNATPDADAIAAGQSKFLGRYGVVRDNWYKLTIDKVTKIGSATPEDPSIVTPDTPDDEIENYMSVHVHIVPWVLRSQSVNL